jgi:hypothetical protein
MAGLAVTQLADLGGPADLASVEAPLLAALARQIDPEARLVEADGP